ncbi:MAG: GAF domain-containing sensor histidine kinase [Chloroflexi bacterium]|nr:GAF domain-containing sensor histidine kinase [Chloroflexota bacterium]
MNTVEKRMHILERLAQISLVLNSTVRLEMLLGHVMDAAAEITEAEAASVLLWSSQTRELHFAATTTVQRDQPLIGQTVPLAGSIAGAALQNNQIVQVDDTAGDPRHYNQVDQENRFQTRSLLAVPLTYQDRVMGVLEIVNKRALPWTDADREYAGILAAQAAVAIERAQLVDALRRANQELNELDQIKNDFIAIASHELRTPLAVILGYASFLQEEAEGEMVEMVGKVVASGMQLRRIIEDLTNLRYLHQSAGELKRARVPLAELIEEAVLDVNDMAEAKGHKLDVALPEARITVEVDRIRLAMALTNLLNNAVRFTPENGHIQVRTEERPDEVWVLVSDSGIGLEADQLERVFERFYQVEDSMTRHHGGMGIGLSIVRALAEAHGGRVWASSPGLGRGATFTLALPLAESSLMA